MVANYALGHAARRAGVVVVRPDGRRFGANDPAAPVMQVATRAFIDRVGRDFGMAVGEGYMAGEWTTGPDTDLGDLLTSFARQLDLLIPFPLRTLRRWLDPRRPARERNTRDGAEHNIHQHYDLANEMFAAFLDETMTYSSAWFGAAGTGDRDLAAAQRAKIDRLLDEARVGTGTTLLEIGTGWGQLAIQAAQRGASVHTITLSNQQLELARKRAAEAGVADRVRMERRDYRDLDERYDAAVSVEMIEAVGEEFLPAYFGAVARALAPGGRFGLQAITMPHERMLRTRHHQTWTLRYIFPGGFLASPEQIGEISSAAGLRTEGRPFALDADYARTLREWRSRFWAAADTIGELGFDGAFQRMWAFYLAQSEAGFRSHSIGVAQWTFVKE